MSYNTLTELFKGICDAIRSKDGSREPINHQDIPDRISAITGGGNGMEILSMGTVQAETSYYDGLNEYGDIIPVMSSGTGLGATVMASSQYSDGYAGYKALDGNNSTFWAHGTGASTLSSGREMPCCLDVELARNVSFDGYYLRGGAAGEYPKAWELLGSNDGETYTVLDTRNEDTALSDTQIHKYALEKTENWKYVRLRVTDSTNYCGISRYNLTREEKE